MAVQKSPSDTQLVPVVVAPTFQPGDALTVMTALRADPCTEQDAEQKVSVVHNILVRKE